MIRYHKSPFFSIFDHSSYVVLSAKSDLKSKNCHNVILKDVETYPETIGGGGRVVHNPFRDKFNIKPFNIKARHSG